MVSVLSLGEVLPIVAHRMGGHSFLVADELAVHMPTALRVGPRYYQSSEDHGRRTRRICTVGLPPVGRLSIV